MMLHGLRVFESPLMTETKEVHRKPRKWARRVMYQPWREFDVTYAQVPSRQVIKTDEGLFMHPALVAEVKEALAREEQRGRHVSK